MPETCPCPKCNRLLRASGRVDVDGRGELDVFQCDECLATWTFDGEEFETSLTFAVDAAGRLYDPESGARLAFGDASK